MLAQRDRPAPPRGDAPRARAAGRPGRRRRPGRHAHPAAAVLPPVPDPGVAGGADAAGGRRADHRGDRPRAAGPGGRRSPSGSAAPSSGSRPAAPSSALPPPAELAERLAAVLHVLYLIFNEGYTASSGPALHRVELSGEAIRLTRQLHALPARRRRGRRAARADAAHRRPPAGPHRPRRRAGAAGRAGPQPLGRDRHRRGHRAGHRRAGQRAASGPYQLQAAIAAVHDEAAPRRGHRLAADPRPLRPAAARSRPGRWSRSAASSRSPWCDGPQPGCAQLDAAAADPALAGHHRSTPSGRTCSSWPATRPPRASRLPPRRRGARSACRSSATSRPAPWPVREAGVEPAFGEQVSSERERHPVPLRWSACTESATCLYDTDSHRRGGSVRRRRR